MGLFFGAGCVKTFAQGGGTAQNAIQVLDHGWQFRQSPEDSNASNAEWLPATVPGDVHLDLLANKRIPDPFYRDNEAKLQWIDQASWEYQLNFDVPAAFLARANVDLVFDGLDAAAEVYLNDARVLSADNMFRVWRVPAKDHLHAGKNLLRVVFPSPIKAAEKVAATDPWQPKTKTQPRPISVKLLMSTGGTGDRGL
jgi:beta-mannosidase